MTSKNLWGPWARQWKPNDPLDFAERAAQLRSLATLVHIHRVEGWPTTDQLLLELRRAETSYIHLEKARLLFDGLPSLQQRHVITTWSVINDVTRLTKWAWGGPDQEAQDQEQLDRIG